MDEKSLKFIKISTIRITQSASKAPEWRLNGPRGHVVLEMDLMNGFFCVNEELLKYLIDLISSCYVK